MILKNYNDYCEKINFLHLASGLIFLAVSVFLLIKFHQDFRHLLEPTLNTIYLIRFIIFLLSALFGISYIYYGLNSNEIDKTTNTSLIILLSSVIVSLFLNVLSASYKQSFTLIALSFYILAVGIISSLVLLLPLFRNYEK